MKMKRILQVAMLSVGLASTAGQAEAITNMFTPVTGAEFVAETASPNVTKVNGNIVNRDSNYQNIEASLGRRGRWREWFHLLRNRQRHDGVLLGVRPQRVERYFLAVFEEHHDDRRLHHVYRDDAAFRWRRLLHSHLRPSSLRLEHDGRYPWGQAGSLVLRP